jgi:hypothetical protein
VWTTTLKILGIYFSYDDNVMMSLNYDDKIKTLSNVLNMWKQRDLTVLGKITIIKTFGLASLLYTSAMIGMPLSVQKKSEFNNLSIYMERPRQSQEVSDVWRLR